MAIIQGTQYSDYITGTADSDQINTGAGIDLLDGGGGTDTMIGGEGNDSIVGHGLFEGGTGDDALVGNDCFALDGDTYIFNLGDGKDSICDVGTNIPGSTAQATDVLKFGAGISASQITLTHSGNDLVLGISATDQVTISYWFGNTTFNTIESIQFADGTIWDSVAFRGLTLALNGTSGNDDITGLASEWSGHYSITGGAGNDTLSGSNTSDTIDGGAGVDTVSYASAGSAVTVLLYNTTAPQATGGSGSDTLLNIENLIGSNYDDQLKGNNANNVLTGGAGNDLLDGWSGADTMIGGAGNDRYYVNISGDVVVETDSSSVTGGVDTVYSMLSGYTLGANVENGVLYTNSAINMTGNSLNNVLTGNINANVLDGAAGADTMIGGDGSDRYEVDNVGDMVSETNADSVTGGVDTVSSSVNYTLGSNVENLILTDTAAVGTGNALDNILTGNINANVLDGAAGADTMIGGDGSDRYEVDNVGDVVSETNADSVIGGVDTVSSSVNYTLGSNVENLILTGTAAVGTGNGLDNTITANAADNTIDGGTGIDTVTYASASSAVTVLLYSTTAPQATGGSGNDTLLNIENLIGSNYDDQLKGNNANNVLTGGAGNDLLDGWSGADTMIGGAGNDRYYVNISGDVVIETDSSSATGGVDTVYSMLSGYTLGANVENGVLYTSSAMNMTGNNLNNVLTGNINANVLDGAAGADTMTGGAGNDTFKFSNLSDLGLGAGSRDVITDFTQGQDKIDLSTIDANLSTVGDQAFSLVTSFSTTAGEVRYSGGIIYFNTDNDTAAEYEIQLTGTVPASLTAADFVL